MTKDDLLEKINECKKLFSNHADTFFKLNDADLFSKVSDMIENIESEIMEDDDEEFLAAMDERVQHFINMIRSTEYFYTRGCCGLDENEKDTLSHGIRKHSIRQQDIAREKMNQEALKVLDNYVINLDMAMDEILKKVPLEVAFMSVYKSLNFPSGEKFCSSDDEAGVTVTLRIRTTIMPSSSGKGEAVVG